MSGRTPTGLLSVVLTPKTSADRERLDRGLSTLLAEDAALTAKPGPAPGEVVVAGVGELHLEIALDRLRREFDVEAFVGPPQIAYKETLTRRADGEMKYWRVTDGRGDYGHVKIHVCPADPGTGYTFENEIPPGAIPGEFVGAIDEGIQNALALGVLAGYPLDDVRIELYDGSYHAVDSSKAAFRIAGSLAFRDAARRANPVLLEPVMRVEVIAPADYADDVIANLSSRRGEIQSREEREGMQVLVAHVPLSEMFGYAVDLRDRTFGHATFAMQFARYQPVEPPPRGEDDPMVGVPRRPSPPIRQTGVALPEPIESDPEE